MLLLTIQFFYGSFTLGFLVFLFVSYNALIEFFMSEAIFEENRDDDDTDESNPVDIEQDEVGLYDRMLTSPSFNYHLEELNFSFFRLLYLFGLIWLASFLGVGFFISSYLFFVVTLYAYSFLNNYFKGRVLYSTARLDSFDPRPGFAVNPVVSSPFAYLDSITVLNKNSSVLGSKVGLFYSLETLVHDRIYLDPLAIAFSKEPALFSKFNYFYIQFYVLSSIHKYWTSILDTNFTLQRENALTSQGSFLHRPIPPFIFDSYSLLIGGESFFLTSEILLRRFAISESSRLYVSLCFPSPLEKLGVRTGTGKISFPFYRYRPRLLELVFSVLSKLLIRLSSCATLSFPSTANRDYFDSSSRESFLSYFRLFPSSYFFNWASFFFSSRLDYVSFRFKDTLISEDWQALSSFGDTPLKFSNSRLLPSFFSGKASSFEVLKNLLMRSPPFPASPDSHYYFVKGYLSFYTSEVLRLTRTLEMSYLYGPIRRYFMGVRYKNKRIEPGSYLSLRRSGYNSFSIREWVGRSGDGLEPFLSPSSYFLFRASSFKRLSLARITNQKKLILPTLTKGAGFFRLRLIIPKFYITLFSSDPSWKFLKQLVSHSPDLSLYMQNIAQNPLASEFSKGFFKKYPDLFFDGSCKEALNVLGLVVHSRFREFTPPYVLKPVFSALGFSSSLLSRKVSVRGLTKTCLPFSKTVKFRRNRFAGPKLLKSKSPVTRYFQKSFGKIISWPASRRFLGRGSLWSIVKMRSPCFPNFNNIRIRSGLRTLVRDPFGPYTQKLSSRSVIKFRRFFWRSCFERPVRALLLSDSDTIPHPILISRYLQFYLGDWLRSSFSLKSSFLVYVLSDFSLITRYFLSGTPHAIESARLWSLVWVDPFLIGPWKIFFRCLFSQQTSFFMFFSSARFTGALKSNAYMSLYFSSNPFEALRFATLLRDSLILNFPNRLLSKLALKVSVFHRSVSTRGHWKFFSSTLSTLFYTLFSSLLRSGFREFFIPLNFFQLLKHYSSSVADYSHFVRHLFPSFSTPPPWITPLSIILICKRRRHYLILLIGSQVLTGGRLFHQILT